jgi:hypothetical protein
MARQDCEVRSDPLAVMVHIPKTAGSAVNEVLLAHFAARHSPLRWRMVKTLLPAAVRDNPVAVRHLAQTLASGYSHIGNYEARPDVFDRLLARSDWVSGHVTRSAFEARLARLGRPARYFTVLRDPVDQIASHYQWWIEIHHRGPLRYYRYPEFARGLSQRIRATDNRDPMAIIPILSLHHTLFLNIPTTYVAGARSSLTEAEARQALAGFEAVGLGAELAGPLHAMTGQAPGCVRRSNSSRSPFDRSVFRTPEMLTFLRERHAADLALFAVAQARHAALRESSAVAVPTHEGFPVPLSPHHGARSDPPPPA